jgi:hypothetical protein
MRTRIWCYAALVALALSLGASFAHVLELSQKLSLGAHDHLTVQSIYQTFGPVAAILESLTLASLVGLVITVRQRAHPGIALGEGIREARSRRRETRRAVEALRGWLESGDATRRQRRGKRVSRTTVQRERRR